MLSLLFLPLAALAAPQPVSYDTPDGFHVYATYYRPERPSARGVLILPDPKEGREQWIAEAESLRAAGFHVLVSDLRGTGESAYQRGIRRDRSRLSAAQLASDADVVAGVRWLRELPATTIRSAALVGSGEGALPVLVARDLDLASSCQAIVSPLPGGFDSSAVRRRGKMLIVVGNGDVLGLEALHKILPADPGRECWLVESDARGAQILSSRTDLLRSWIAWIEGALGSQ